MTFTALRILAFCLLWPVPQVCPELYHGNFWLLLPSVPLLPSLPRLVCLRRHVLPL